MKKLLPIIFSMLALQNTFALDQNEPTTCPSVSALASVGVDSPYDQLGSWNVGKGRNNYGTPLQWTFIFMTGLNADEVTAEKATALANANISKLKFKEGPVDMGDDVPQLWCVYGLDSKDDSMNGVAISPPQQLPDQINIIRKYSAKYS